MTQSKERPYGSPNPVGRPRKPDGPAEKRDRRAAAEEESRLIAAAREKSRAMTQVSLDNAMEVTCGKCGHDGRWVLGSMYVVHDDGTCDEEGRRTGRACILYGWSERGGGVNNH